MFGEGHGDSIVQRGLDEALACQDMLERTPTKPCMLTRVISRIALAVRSAVHQAPAGTRPGVPTVPRGTQKRWQE
jgi:hypothetical protein